MAKPWRKLLGRILVLFGLTATLGGLFGQMLPALLVAALACLGWQLFHLYRLEQWLRHGSPTRPPDTYPFRPNALWNEIYQRSFRLRQRSRKRKRKVSRILKQFQSAAAALPDAVVVLNEEDTVLWCNEAAQRLLNLYRQDSGLKVTSLVRHPKFIHFLAQRRYDESLEFPSPLDADIMLSVRIAPYGKKQRLLLATDNTRLHRLEQMRRDFVANVSHELRTPLTVINGYLETLLDNEDVLPSRWQKPLSGMHQQSCRMLRIVEDLLMLSRLENLGERQWQRIVDVPALLDEIAEYAIALSGERGHRVVLEADRGLWLRGHEQELHSAFSNLVSNAVRYTPDGGHITIRWYAGDRGVHLEVEDNGEGIPPQHLHRITERFYRVNRDRSRDSGGTGLGLAIVKHVMLNHGGKLHITSLVGVGSIFACDFPAELQVRQVVPVEVEALEQQPG
ncbi:MAG TPA: phosphate regulon sensor histidine kinase PhoR [Candidatus Competibacteraceae bacterium]|nr:phosphate regulon sensor histidine kinase PhoR [Candidatus Competibacteraceae bacterium]